MKIINPQAIAEYFNYEQGMEFVQNIEDGGFDIAGWPDSLPALTDEIILEAMLQYDKKEKTKNLEVEFVKGLNAGFISDALGADHKYDSEQHNRENLIGAVASGLDMPFTCDDLKNTANSKVMREHTHEQLKQVLVDGAMFKESLIIKLRNKREQVALAANQEALDLIEW